MFEQKRALEDAQRRLEATRLAADEALEEAQRAASQLEEARAELRETQRAKDDAGTAVDEAAAKMPALAAAANRELLDDEQAVQQAAACRAADLRERGNAALRAGDAKAAHQFYTAALGPPTLPCVLAPAEHAKILGNRAAALLSARRFDEALADANAAVELCPSTAKNHLRAAAAAAELGLVERARASASKARDLEPGSAEIVRFCSQLEDRGHGGAALRGREGAAPTADTLREEGNAALKRGDTDAAIDLYGRAIAASVPGALREAKAPSARAKLFANRSNAHLRAGNVAAAAADAEAAVAESPAWSKAHFRLGTALTAKKEPTKAYASFKRASHLDPSNGELTSACRRAREAMLGVPLCQRCGDPIPCGSPACCSDAGKRGSVVS